MANSTWQDIENGRLRLYKYLLKLSLDSWQKRSSRTGWSVKELTAHIILESNYTLPVIAKHILQAKFNTNKFMDLSARHFAKTNSIPAVLASLQKNILNHRLPPGITAKEALIDLWIHEQDIIQAITGNSKLSQTQIDYILNYVTENLDSKGLKVMGLDEELSINTYLIIDKNNLSIGHGQNIVKLTSSQLFDELIGLKLS